MNEGDYGVDCQRKGCAHYRAEHLNGNCDWPGCSCPNFLDPDHDDEMEARR